MTTNPAKPIFLITLLLYGCGGDSDSPPGNPSDLPVVQACDGFGEWSTSAFVLPYPVGLSYRVNQANCSGFGHSDFWQFGYDFEMPIGSLITAARDGVVVHAQDGAIDGDRNRTNLITIEHTDGTVALYLAPHIKRRACNHRPNCSSWRCCWPVWRYW